MNFATTATAAAKQIVLALINLDAYNPETDDDMAMAIATNIPDDCNIVIGRIDDEIHITFSVENESIYGNFKAYFSSPARGYTVSPVADETFPTNVTLSKKGTMKQNDSNKDVEKARMMSDKTRQAIAAKENEIAQIKKEIKDTVTQDADEGLVTQAQAASSAFAAQLKFVAESFSAKAAEAKAAQEAKSWYTSTPVKITAAVAGTAAVAAFAYFGLKHFGVIGAVASVSTGEVANETTAA